MIITGFPGGGGGKAISEESITSGDLLEYIEGLKDYFHVIYTSASVENTPYKKGYTGGNTAGIVLSAQVGNGKFVTALYIPIGLDDRIFVISRNGSTWSGWKKITAADAAASDEAAGDMGIV